MLNQFTASLWGDEAFSAVLSLNPVLKILEIISKDTSPPLYNLTLHFWYQVFGVSEVSIRALSFTYYLLAIFFVFQIVNLLWGKKTALIASLLTFLNPFFFTYAFEGRMYSILALGVCSSFYFFFRILKGNPEEKGKKKKVKTKTPGWIIPAYAVSVAWALYSHHFAMFAIFVQGVWFLVEFLFGKRGAAKKIFKGLLLAGLLYLPWVYPLYKQTTMVAGGFWLGTPSLLDLRNLVYEYLAEGIKNPSITIPFVDRNLGQIALYFVFAGLLLRKWHKGIKKSFILLLWFSFPILATFFISQKMQSIFFNRYLLYSIPPAMILLSSNGRKYSGIIFGIVILIFAITDFNYFTHPTKRPFRQLSQYVKETKKEGDSLINWNSSAHHLWESKFYEIPAPIYNPGQELPYYVGTAQMTDSDIIKEIPQTKRVGVITSGPIEEVKIKDYTITSEETFGDLKFIWFTKE